MLGVIDIVLCGLVWVLEGYFRIFFIFCIVFWVFKWVEYFILLELLVEVGIWGRVGGFLVLFGRMLKYELVGEVLF